MTKAPRCYTGGHSCLNATRWGDGRDSTAPKWEVLWCGFWFSQTGVPSKVNVMPLASTLVTWTVAS